MIVNKLKMLVLIMLLGSSVSAQIIDEHIIMDVAVYPETKINTAFSEYSPTYYFDGIAYVSASDTSVVDESIGEPFHNILCAIPDAGGEMHRIKPIDEINSPQHEGPLAFDAVRNIIYYTRVEVIRNKAVRRIYIDEENEISRPISFSGERDQVCHPTLNTTGDRMIFSADYGQGHMELYTARLSEDGWSDPKRIENIALDTFHNFFPFLVNDSTLVFSSDRPGGYGGYDLYITKNEETGWSEPELLPPPFNSSEDDLGLIMNPEGTKGYYASNRPGGQGKDDIYRWESDRSIFYDIKNYLSTYDITVRNKLNFEAVDGAEITITRLRDDAPLAQLRPGDNVLEIEKVEDMILAAADKDEHSKITLVTDVSGNEKAELFKKGTYAILTRAPGYDRHVLIYKTTPNEPINIMLEPIAEEEPTPEKEIIIPTVAGETVVFDNIYYEYNSSKIKEGAAQELDALYKAMRDNPDMMVQLAAHTDSRGPSSYNQQLSEKRAASAKNYLVKKGIHVDRIISVGFGESRLRNDCTDEVPCTEEEHRYNRRTEVKVLAF